jgi:hypothetical protein
MSKLNTISILDNEFHIIMYPVREDKLLSPSGVNVPRLFGKLFWRVGSVAHKSLIIVRIVV